MIDARNLGKNGESLRTYTATIKVDVEQLLETANEDLDIGEHLGIDEALSRELGWVHQSGISITNIKPSE